MIFLKRLVVPETLATVALQESDDIGIHDDYSAGIVIEFRGVEKVKELVIVWQSEEAAKKHGAVDPVSPDKLGEVLENKAYAKLVEELLKTEGLNYLKMEEGELKFDCTMLSPYEQNILLRRLVANLERISHLMAELFGWNRLPACVGRRVWEGLDCDLVDGGEGGTGWVYPPRPSWYIDKRLKYNMEEPRFLSLVSYSIAHIGYAHSCEDDGEIPVLRCVATYREEVSRALSLIDV